MDLGGWTAADIKISMRALNESTSYEHYIELCIQFAADELVAEIERELP